MNPTTGIQWRFSASEHVTLTPLSKTVADPDVPERITATRGTYFRHATFMGKKGARTNNTSAAYIGPQSENGAQALLVAAGGEVSISAPIGCKFDLYDLYLDVATAGDGVQILYS